MGDHPRLCGEKYGHDSGKTEDKGSPPPMRGKEAYSGDSIVGIRITPAYAGKSTSGVLMNTMEEDHPRLCGEK